MLENGKMGLLRRFFEAILGHNVINRHFSDVICRLFGNIRGPRPANLDPRVKPVDDNGMKSVTSGNDNVERVIDYKKKNTITFNGLDVVRQYAALLERRVQSSTQVRKAQAVTRQTNPIGRSMIEMLGVLAIIAVLSVGGIAGYGKAMRIWNSNQQKEQMTQILHSLIRLRYELGREKNRAPTTPIMPVLKAIDEIPAGLTFGANNELMDKNDNRYYASYGQNCWRTKQDSEEKTCAFQYFLRISLVKTDSSLVPSSEDACANFINIAKENVKDVVSIATFWGNPKDDDNPNHWRGYEQKTAFTQTTLKTVSPLQISNVCKECKNHSSCMVTLYLKTS